MIALRRTKPMKRLMFALSVERHLYGDVKQVELPMKGEYPIPHLMLKKDLPRMMCCECINTILGKEFCVQRKHT
jgi:hypothetical protein